MGSGVSPVGKSKTKAKATAPAPAAPKKANTPSGMTYSDFMKLSNAERLKVMVDIIKDPNMDLPSSVNADNSVATKVMYALGMDKSTTVVSDAQLDAMPGKDIYRTVYQLPGMPPPTSSEILDQVRNGDYTYLSGAGGSVHGRAIYFADGFQSSARFGLSRGPESAVVMRCKVNQNAKIVDESVIDNGVNNHRNWRDAIQLNGKKAVPSEDLTALYAIHNGYDGWRDSFTGYTMILNRGALTSSATTKSIGTPNANGAVRSRVTFATMASSWDSAAEVK